MSHKILIADDELAIRDLLYDVLQGAGYQVTTVCNGPEALESVQRDKPDLILLDFKMSGADGLQTLQEVKAIDKKIKIIILSGMEDEDLEKKARLLGASGFLRKSLGIEIVVKTVNELFRQTKEYGESKILVIDDNPQISGLIKDFLSKKGFDVVTATSGEEGIEKFKHEKPILILLDVKLPGMDGILTLKRIRALDDEVGVVMITGEKDQGTFDEAKKLGAYEYIVKPFDLDYLETCVLVRVSIVSALLD